MSRHFWMFRSKRFAIGWAVLGSLALSLGFATASEPAPDDLYCYQLATG